VIKFCDFDIRKLPYIKCTFALLNNKVKQSKMSIEAKFYENYQETNTPGIYLSDDEKEVIDKRVAQIEQEEIKNLLESDYIALNELLKSKGWEVFLKYIEGMEFDVNEGTLTEKLAFKQAKEQAINSVISIPQSLVKFYTDKCTIKDN